jgi:hypothetical protein
LALVLHSRIDGDVLKPAERQRLISEFNADATIDCFLLTTQTGGFGISLTGADRVIIFGTGQLLFPLSVYVTDNRSGIYCSPINEPSVALTYSLFYLADPHWNPSADDQVRSEEELEAITILIPVMGRPFVIPRCFSRILF